MHMAFLNPKTPSEAELAFRRPSALLLPNYRRDSLLNIQRRGSIILNGQGFSVIQGQAKELSVSRQTIRTDEFLTT